MTNKKVVLALLLVTVVGMIGHPAFAALSLLTGVDYSSGEYGDTEEIRILYIPVTAKYEADRYVVRLTVPYVEIDAPSGGDIVAIGPGEQPLRSGAGNRETNAGLGDVVASAGYTVFESAPAGVILDLVGKVKFGTADADDGLGTGETDYAMQLDGYKKFGSLTLLATLGYRVYGDPPGSDFDNVPFGALGAVYKFSPDTSAGVIFDMRDNIVLDSDPQYELSAFVTRKIGGRTKLQGYVLTGFSDSSPDWGGGLMVIYEL